MSTGSSRSTRTRRFAEVKVPQRTAMLLQKDCPPAPPPKDLGPLKNLIGSWEAHETGWNMIALPFQKVPSKFRILMNQYSEKLNFTFVDDDVPNRGLERVGAGDADQFVVTLDYQQVIAQVHALDFPRSADFGDDLAGPPCLGIHHEPGLWLYEKNRRSVDDAMEQRGAESVAIEEVLDVARLASIPHGNSVLAVGTSKCFEGMPEIPPISGLPSGRFEDVSTPGYDFADPNADPYLAPYRHFIDTPYIGKEAVGFPGFSPADMNALLRLANTGVEIERTTTLTVDSTRRSAGIRNLPFSVREAEPVSMKSTFWIQELKERVDGKPKLRLQYSQVVMLNFFRPREDGFPERAVWPHISIATLNKVTDDPLLVAAV